MLRKFSVIALATISFVAVITTLLAKPLDEGEPDPGTVLNCWNGGQISADFEKVDAKECDNNAVCIKYTYQGTVNCTAKKSDVGCNWAVEGVVKKYNAEKKSWDPVGEAYCTDNVTKCGTSPSISGSFTQAGSTGDQLKITFTLYKGTCKAKGTPVISDEEQLTVPSP